jgi:hypothetical protein
MTKNFTTQDIQNSRSTFESMETLTQEPMEYSSTTSNPETRKKMTLISPPITIRRTKNTDLNILRTIKGMSASTLTPQTQDSQIDINSTESTKFARQTKERTRASSTNDQTANRMLVIRAIHETDKISQKQQKESREFNAIRMYKALDVIRTIHIAHFDNSAMTSTTHYLPALWHYRPFDLHDPPPQPLEVAD